MSEWIKCSDRLPEFDFTSNRISMYINVIAVLIDGKVEAMSYKSNGWTKEDSKPTWQYADGRSIKSHLITHWMPLPPPPPEVALNKTAC